MSEKSLNDAMVISRAAAAGRRVRVAEVQCEMYARSERDGSEVLYLNDGALQLYRDAGGERPVDESMETRPPDTADPDDFLRQEALLLRAARLSLTS